VQTGSDERQRRSAGPQNHSFAQQIRSAAAQTPDDGRPNGFDGRPNEFVERQSVSGKRLNQPATVQTEFVGQQNSSAPVRNDFVERQSDSARQLSGSDGRLTVSADDRTRPHHRKPRETPRRSAESSVLAQNGRFSGKFPSFASSTTARRRGVLNKTVGHNARDKHDDFVHDLNCSGNRQSPPPSQ
jgi:hypothetical protein